MDIIRTKIGYLSDLSSFEIGLISISFDKIIYSVSVITGDVSCPDCGSIKVRKFGHRFNLIKDIPELGKWVTLKVLNRRYRCNDCSSTFSFSIPHTHKNRRITQRLYHYILEDLGSFNASKTSKLTGLNEKTIRDIRTATLDNYYQTDKGVIS